MVLAYLLLAGAALAATPAEDLDALLKQPRPEPALALAEAGGPALPQIQAALEANSTAAPLMAWALQQKPVPEAREALEKALGSTDQRLGYWAAFALGRLGDARSAAALAAVMPKTDAPKQYWELAYWTPNGWVSWFERKYEPNGNVILPPAPEGVSNLRVAYASLEALGMVGGPMAVETLTRMLRSDQWLIRYGAVRGLGAMRDEAARDEIARLRDTDPTLVVRRTAGRMVAANGAAPMRPLPAAEGIPAIAFIKTSARTESSLGFQDSYFYPTMPWYHWGQNVYTLTPPAPDGKLVNLTNFEHARVQGLEASYDAQRLLFSMCDDRKKTGFHICEINVDGSGFRQITRGNCNDVDPCYLPDGRIVFSSDRSGHHEYYHQERSRNLFVMEPDGSNLQRISFNPNQDYAPYVLSSGLVAYTSYRFYGQDGSGNIYGRDSDLSRIETQLRAVNPDGTGDTLLYGAMRGGFYVPLRPMPDSLQDSGSEFRRGTDFHLGVSVSWVRELRDGKLVCVTPAGLTLLDLAADPLACERPCFPEIVNLAGGEQVYIHSHDELNPVGRYTSPYPADEGRLFVSHAPFWDTGFDAYGLYLFDMATRELTLVHDEPGVSDVDPVALTPRPLPRRLQPNLVERKQSTGTILCLSVFNSDLEYSHEAARYVRVLGVTLMGQTVNANAAFETAVLGTVPLQKDGSFKVEVPADRPVRFQILDADENLLLHETEFNYVRGGETLSCLGCHEPKGRTPPSTEPLAAALPPYPALERVGDLRYHGQVWRGYNRIARP